MIFTQRYYINLFVAYICKFESGYVTGHIHHHSAHSVFDVISACSTLNCVCVCVCARADVQPVQRTCSSRLLEIMCVDRVHATAITTTWPPLNVDVVAPFTALLRNPPTRLAHVCVIARIVATVEVLKLICQWNVHWLLPLSSNKFVVKVVVVSAGSSYSGICKIQIYLLFRICWSESHGLVKRELN